MPHREESLPKSQITHLTPVRFEHEIESENLCFALVATGRLLATEKASIPPDVLALSAEFSDVLLIDLPFGLPQMRDIQY